MTTETTQSPVTTTTTTDKLLDLPEVLGMVRISRTVMYGLIAAEKFPAGVSITDAANRRVRCAYWKLSDVQNWISQLPTKQTEQK